MAGSSPAKAGQKRVAAGRAGAYIRSKNVAGMKEEMDSGTTALPRSEFRGRVYDSIVETIGATPLVRIRQLARNNAAKADIPGKCEFFNRWVRPRTVSVSR